MVDSSLAWVTKSSLVQVALWTANEDISDLQQAVENDGQPTNEGKLGPRVSSWIGGMVKKAADGSWGVGVSAAGNLLARAIAKYYGLQ